MKAVLSIRVLKLPINTWEDVLESPLELITWDASYFAELMKFSPKGSIARQIYEQKIYNQDTLQDKGGLKAVLELVEEGNSILGSGIESTILNKRYPCQLLDVKALR